MKELAKKLTWWNFFYLFGFGSYVSGLVLILKYGVITMEPTVNQYADIDWLFDGIIRILIGLLATFIVRKRKTIDLFKGLVR